MTSERASEAEAVVGVDVGIESASANTPTIPRFPRSTMPLTLHLPGGRDLDRPRSSFVGVAVVVACAIMVVGCHFRDDSGEVVTLENACDWDGSP